MVEGVVYEKMKAELNARIAELEADNARLEARRGELTRERDQALSIMADRGEILTKLKFLCEQVMRKDLDWELEYSGDPLADIEMALSGNGSRVADVLAAAQGHVSDWVRLNFGDDAMDRQERATRVLEEAIELAQAEGIRIGDVNLLTGHVYTKPAGEPSQEVGGIGVCLLAWAGAAGQELWPIIETEIDRIHTKTADHFRARHQVKVDAGVAKKALDAGEGDDANA